MASIWKRSCEDLAAIQLTVIDFLKEIYHEYSIRRTAPLLLHLSSFLFYFSILLNKTQSISKMVYLVREKLITWQQRCGILYATATINHTLFHCRLHYTAHYVDRKTDAKLQFIILLIRIKCNFTDNITCVNNTANKHALVSLRIMWEKKFRFLSRKWIIQTNVCLKFALICIHNYVLHSKPNASFVYRKF